MTEYHVYSKLTRIGLHAQDIIEHFAEKNFHCAFYCNGHDNDSKMKFSVKKTSNYAKFINVCMQCDLWLCMLKYFDCVALLLIANINYY